jgi:4-hydroxy-tetrahydrodipicolinate synthase
MMWKDDIYRGIWPAMITPFDEKREIDWASLERLIEWYIAAGVHGLFAACQSSEIFFLSDDEIVRLARFVVERVDGRVPVIASGHTANAFSQQIDQINAVAATGVASVVLIGNRLAMPDESDDKMRENLAGLVSSLPKEIDLGIYECPYPYKRLLDDETMRWCAQSGRFTFLKDTCCNLDRIKRRIELVKGSRLHIANANSQTLLPSLQAGVDGYSGVMANFHPDLYVWLYENWQQNPVLADQLQNYLSVSAMVETLSYPICAKDYHVGLGTFVTAQCRAKEINGYFCASNPQTVRQMIALGEELKTLLKLGKADKKIA